MNADVTQLLEWIKVNVPTLIRSGENWQIVLHGRNDGNVNAEVKTTCQVINPKRRELNEGHVRPVRQSV